MDPLKMASSKYMSKQTCVLILVLIPMCATVGHRGNFGTFKRSTLQDDQVNRATIEYLLTNSRPDPAILRRVDTTIASNDQKVNFIDDLIKGLPKNLWQMLVAAKAIDIEHSLRNKNDQYSLILQEIRALHANMSNYDNETFLTIAGNIQRNLDKVLDDVSRNHPDQLRTLDRLLTKSTIVAPTESEGVICDASVDALRELKSNRNFSLTVSKGPVAMVEAFASLQDLATDLFALTCSLNDPVCLSTVALFRQNPQQQRVRLEQCIPAWVVSLAKYGVVSGRLQRGYRAVAQVEVYFSDSDQTRFYPELHNHSSTEEGSHQQVKIQESGGYHRLVVGKTCFVSLQNSMDFVCLARSTNQDALFAVETSRDGNTWLWNVQTQRYLVAGETQVRCREGVLSLSPQNGEAWTFDSSFIPDNDNNPPARDCLPPLVADGSGQSIHGFLLLTGAVMAFWLAL